MKVHYNCEKLGPPILSVEDAVAKESYFQVPEWCSPMPVEDFAKGMSEADCRIESAEVTFPISNLRSFKWFLLCLATVVTLVQNLISKC